jgi:hypothetical protein
MNPLVNSSSSLYLCHHFGLGDHIVCFSIVKHYTQKTDSVFVFAKRSNILSAKFLYLELPSVTVIPAEHDVEASEYCTANNVNCFKIGFNLLPQYQSQGLTWPEAFYKQCDIPYFKRWEDFSIKRNPECEEKMFRFKNPINEKYALIHSFSSNGENGIDYSQVNPSLKQVEVTKEKIGSQSIFDYIKLILEADEIHCIDSAFIHLVDSFKLNNKLFYHKNYKYRGNTSEYPLQNDWTII